MSKSTLFSHAVFILALILLVSFMAYNIFYLKSWIMYLALAAGFVFIAFAFFLPKNVKVNVALVLFSIMVTIYSLDVIVYLVSRYLLPIKSRYSVGIEQGVPFDTRSKL